MIDSLNVMILSKTYPAQANYGSIVKKKND